MNIVIIGTGNVATVLGKKITEAGHDIRVYKRHSFNDIDQTSDLYIIAISDDALYELTLQLENKLVVHTAGSVSRDVLKNISSNYGVLYPLQSLRKELEVLTEIPLLVDANTEANRQTLLQFAKTISRQVIEADDEQRMKLHVAAVVVNNFTNHLYALAEDYCKKENLDFTLLYPLIDETAQRLRFLSPAQLQTGPAVREDDVTINKHLKLLRDHPSLEAFYNIFTKSIKENGSRSS